MREKKHTEITYGLWKPFRQRITNGQAYYILSQRPKNDSTPISDKEYGISIATLADF